MNALKLSLLSILPALVITIPAYAQINPDVNSSINTSVSFRKNGNYVINGGLRKGKSLFHSFKTLNLERRRNVFFNSPKNVNNIFARIIGGSGSVINGTVKTKRNTSLLLMNSDGFTFGNNARLNIGGSFISTTASSLVFDNGFEFGILDPETTPDNGPRMELVSLKFSKPSSSITINSSGHTIRNASALMPLNITYNNGLRSDGRSTIGFYGGQIVINGGVLDVSNGSIQLSSLESGTLEVNRKLNNASLGSNNLNNIVIKNNSLLNSNDIKIVGANIQISNGSLLSVQRTNEASSGKITLHANNNLVISGISPDGSLRTSIASDNFINTRGANVEIFSKNITVDNGAVVGARTFGTGESGNISIESLDNISVSDFSPLSPFIFSSIITSTFSSAKSGNINVIADNLDLKDGGVIGSSTFASGESGAVKISAKDINVLRASPVSRTPSAIISSTFGSGNAGLIQIKSNNLNVKDGARIASSTTNTGNAGNIEILNEKNILISGEFDSSIPSLIDSSSVTAPERIVPLSAFLTGKSGDILIKSGSVNITEKGQLSVRNDGINDAGIINIRADTIALKNAGNISASTNGGNGGNVRLKASRLSLTNSSITSSAQNAGQGGNIQIQSILATLNQQSSVEANAQNNRAGNISWTTNTLLAAPSSQVTATSARGTSFDGRIETSIQSTQLVNTVKLASIGQLNTDISQICGFDGNRLSNTSESDFEDIANSPDLITAWNVQQRYQQNNGKFFRDVKSGEVKPIRPVLALEYLENGEFRSIYEPSESKYISNLLSSLERKCSKLRST